MYTYTYDDGDNLLTKVSPFEDNFNDANGTGWSTSGTWTFTGDEARSDVASSWTSLYRAVADDDHEIRFDYMLDSNSTAGNPVLYVYFRSNTTSSEKLLLQLFEDKAVLLDYDGSSWTQLDIDTGVDSDEDTWYTARIVADGASVKIYRADRGGMESLIFDESAAPEYNGNRFQFTAQGYTEAVVDNIRLLVDDLSNTTTYTYANNNELSTMVDYNGTTTFTYDDAGRMITKAIGGDSAVYDYGYGSKMIKVTSDLPGEGTVDYRYGGDGKRRERDDGANLTWYNWDVGFNVINEEDEGAGLGNGTLNKTYAITGKPTSASTAGHPLGGTLVRRGPPCRSVRKQPGDGHVQLLHARQPTVHTRRMGPE